MDHAEPRDLADNKSSNQEAIVKIISELCWGKKITIHQKLLLNHLYLSRALQNNADILHQFRVPNKNSMVIHCVYIIM